MRDTYAYGIDLGTTNSAIATVEDDGSITVIKNNDGWDTTPSVVWIPKAGTVQVGRPALERLEIDPDNCAAEFKLEMGRADANRTFAAAGISLGPPALSAHVVKSMRGDAQHAYGTAPDAAVITVPAAFALNQNGATQKAAELAGLGPACPLIQEPTAAAVAYGFRDSVQEGYWMVFDFGGGTFDAAIVSKRDGDMSVLNHAGDPYLGGKLIDWAVVERLLAPAASRELGLAEFRRDNPRWRVNFGKLKQAAEKAKIALSRNTSALVLVDLDDGTGRLETFEHTLRRGEVDALAEPLFDRAVKLCRDALTEGGLGPGDIDRLVLVGGVTLMPGLRERLSDPAYGLGVRLDHSVDPTTVVAQGAAILGATIRRPAVTRAPEPGEFTATLSYPTVVTSTRATVAGELHSAGAVDWGTYSVVLANPQARPPYRTPRITPNGDGAFIAEVDVDQQTTSRFGIELYDADGTRQRLSPDTLTITHNPTLPPGVTLTSSLGIRLADRGFAPLLRKNATLPARARELFQTSGTLHKAQAEAVIRIPVVQGEDNRGDRNREVGMLEITPRDVRIDVPAGTEIEVTFEVDESSLVTVVADVPLLQTQFEAEINLDDIRAKSAPELEQDLAEIEAELPALRDEVGSSGSDVARRRLERLEGEAGIEAARGQVNVAAVDDGARGAAEDRLRGLRADIEDIQAEARIPGLVTQLREMFTEVDRLIGRFGSSLDREELAGLRRRLDDAVTAGDEAAIRELIDRTMELLISLERQSPDFPVKLFYGLLEDRALMHPADRVRPLVREGEQAIAAGDMAALGGVNQRLLQLLPAEKQAAGGEIGVNQVNRR